MSMEDDYKDYSRENRSLIEEERFKLYRTREKAEAMERNTAKTLANFLRDHKRELAKEASNAVNRGNSGQMSPIELAMVRAAQDGTERPTGIDELVTGFEELPWEKDPY